MFFVIAVYILFISLQAFANTKWHRPSVQHDACAIVISKIKHRYMKRRLLHIIPALAFVVLLFSTIMVTPVTAYAVTAGSTAAPKVDCANGITNPLGWVVCPVVTGLVEAISWIDQLINSQMTIGSDGAKSDPNQIFCNSTSNNRDGSFKSCTAYYNAWSSVRNIALGLMVVVGVIVLIAQALGLEILDAYTIRKVMPRLVIAAVAITLSWQLMQFFVQLSNDLAYGVRYLIYQPFAGLENPILTGSAQGIVNLIGIGALTALGFVGLLSYLATAALAVFVGFLVLVLRELLIIMLIIFAPIAIVAYILPNTQKYYKLWWESFSKALLMFALISGMIALGRVFAVVAGVGEDNINPMSQLVGFAAYFLPYLLIPLTFKFSGAALSGMTNAVQSRSQAGFGAIKGYRGNVAKKNWADLKSGNRLKGEGYGGLMSPYGAFARGFNRTTAGTANIANAGYNPRRMRARMSAARSNRLIDEAKEAMEKNSDVRALTVDDDLVEASNFATDQIRQGSTRGFESLVREDLERRNYHNVEQGTALIRRGRNSMNSDAFDSAMGIAQFGTSSGLTPEYQLNPVTGQEEVVGGAAEGRAMINRIAGNDRQRAIQMLGASRQLAESKGRYDLAGGSFTEDAELLDDLHHGTITQATANQRLLRGALDGTGRGRIFGGHRRNIDAMAPQVRQLLDESFGIAQRQAGMPARQTEPGNPREALEQLAFAANALDAASSNSAESARVVNDQVLSQTVDVSHMSPDMTRLLQEHIPDQFETYVVTDPAGNPVSRLDSTGAPMVDAAGRPVPETASRLTAQRITMTYGEIMEAMRTNPEFGRLRREWGSGQREAAARAGNPPAGP